MSCYTAIEENMHKALQNGMTEKIFNKEMYRLDDLLFRYFHSDKLTPSKVKKVINELIFLKRNVPEIEFTIGGIHCEDFLNLLYETDGVIDPEIIRRCIKRVTGGDFEINPIKYGVCKGSREIEIAYLITKALKTLTLKGIKECQKFVKEIGKEDKQ